MAEDTRHVTILLTMSQAEAISLTVRCPDCRALEGQRCKARGDGKPLNRPHWLRTDNGAAMAVIDKLKETK